MLEIGTRFGESSLEVAKTCDLHSLTCVDPYINYSEYDHDGFSTFLRRFGGDWTYKHAIRNLKKRLGEKVSFIRTFSNDSEEHLAGMLFDVVWVDGNHAEDYCFNDLLLAQKFLDCDGVILGDDYQGEGVRRAVQKFLEIFPNASLVLLGNHGGFPKVFHITFRKQWS